MVLFMPTETLGKHTATCDHVVTVFVIWVLTYKKNPHATKKNLPNDMLNMLPFYTQYKMVSARIDNFFNSYI